MQLRIRAYRLNDEQEVIQLWKRCGLVVPQNDPEKDIARKIAVQPELFLIGVMADRIVATVMAGYEGHRGWINYLAVAPEFQGQGLARRLMDAVESKLRDLGCPKINLQVRETNTAVIEYYERIGFKIHHDVRLGKKLVKD
mgnify:FL=1